METQGPIPSPPEFFDCCLVCFRLVALTAIGTMLVADDSLARASEREATFSICYTLCAGGHTESCPSQRSSVCTIDTLCVFLHIYILPPLVVGCKLLEPTRSLILSFVCFLFVLGCRGT